MLAGTKCLIVQKSCFRHQFKYITCFSGSVLRPLLTQVDSYKNGLSVCVFQIKSAGEPANH